MENYIYVSYFQELSLRIFYSLIFFILFFFIFFFYYKEIYILFTFPLYLLRPHDFHGFISTNFIEFFYLNLYGAFIFGILVTLPYLLLTSWAFIKPALNKNEKWILFNLINFILLLYFFSILYTIYILIPFSWYFFIYEDINFILIQPRIDLFLNHMMTVIFFMIFLFETPLIYFYILYYKLINFKYLFFYFEKIFIILLLLIFIVKSIDIFIISISFIPLYIFYDISLIIYLLIKK